ncbi:MAG TPA: TrkA family potassium uptake protein, partial [Oscillospiraceae bacterium]|nr:TrkA family potassium uptake protein [Oscillospiraceae bacterium]
MRSMLVIGAGRFGRHLSIKLAELGNEVMVVDKDEEVVTKLAPHVTRAQIGDCMDEEVLSALGVGNFDVCFVCISDNFQSSLEITSLLKELGARTVISKTDRDIHAKFLLKIGADDVVYPERDMAQRTANKYSSPNVFDYIELTPEYVIFEMLAPAAWVGKSIRELDVRSKHNINVIGTKRGETVIPMTDA